MKNKLIFTVLFILFVMCISFAQVTTQIQDVLVNNQTSVSNCGLIDVGSTNNNTLTVAFKLSKLENQAVGTILVTVYLKRFGTSDPGTNKGVYSVPSNVWTTQFEGQIPINFSASEIELTGSSIYVKSTENNTFLSDSCEYPLLKTAVPSFNLTPSTVSVSCGSINPVTFVVGNTNIPSGSSLEYVWTIGSGWKFTDGSAAPSTYTNASPTLTLVPNANPPGNVSVVPKLNNVIYPSLTATVSRGNFNPVFTIAGNLALCSTAIYSVDNLPSGMNVTGWSTSNPNIATASLIGGGQGEVTAIGNGMVTIIATIMNSCGQTANITLANVFVGKVVVTNHTLTASSQPFKINTTNQFSVAQVPGQGVSYYWYIVKVSSECAPNAPGAIFPRFFTGSNYTATFTSSYRFATVDWGNCPGNYVVNCIAINACGSTDIGYKAAVVINPYVTDPCAKTKVKIYPNPIKDGVIIVSKPDPHGPPCPPIGGKTAPKKSNQVLVNEVKIYDMMGNMVYNNSFKLHQFTINDMNLKNGSYIMVITDNYNNLDRELLVIDN